MVGLAEIRPIAHTDIRRRRASHLSALPQPDEGTLKAVAELGSKTSPSADQRDFLEYVDLLEEIRGALGGR
jgi:hypothetical protein